MVSDGSTHWQKTTTCRKNLGELTFARIHAGPVFALARLQEKIFEEVFAKFSGEFIRSVRIHAAPVFAPARIQENTPDKLFMYQFRARGYSVKPGFDLRLQNPGFRNRKPWVFINRHLPFPTPENPLQDLQDPPLLVWECIGVHSTMGRFAGASFWGRDGGFSGRFRVEIYEKTENPPDLPFLGVLIFLGV